MAEEQYRQVEMTRLLAEVPAIAVAGPRDGVITGVTSSSSDVAPGACFVAVRGRRADGHAYIGDALARGAILVTGEDPAPEDLPLDRTYVQVADSRRELGTLAAAFYDHPSHRMDVIGVTGTDGKTTTTNLIDALLTAAGRRTGLMSTVDFKIGERRWPNNSRFTTLEAPDVQRVLAQMADESVECAVVETTSSGLELRRVQGVEYDVAVITNITSEHLEVHGTLENYRRAKAMLFEHVDPDRRKATAFSVPRVCILNADDSSFAYLRQFCRAPILRYGIENAADVLAQDVRLGSDGTSFTVRLPDGAAFPVRTPLVARFNVYNCLAAIAVAYVHGIPPAVMGDALERFGGVSGRMERVTAGQPFTVVVDYAHTADSLRKVLEVLRPVTRGRLIAVFGSAGDRDRVKRPQMGAVAAQLADFAVITDEDPREEDPERILREIAAGAEDAGGREGERYVCIVGRRGGIAEAFRRACPGDTVLLAGKGHEQSLVIGREKLPWDDRRVAREELAALGFSEAAV